DLSCAKVPTSGCDSETVGTVTCEKLPNPNPALKLWKCTCTRSLKVACTVECGSKKKPKETPGSLSDPVLP
ncbi:MAG: hypothetical protein KDD53_11330, partial [Bdellovibrionales bacterium]|nr:hypothetical protein [Bdellovibrionales bacterium]